MPSKFRNFMKVPISNPPNTTEVAMKIRVNKGWLDVNDLKLKRLGG